MDKREELKYILGEKLYNRLSYDEIELILNSQKDFTFWHITQILSENRFLVRDLKKSDIVYHPSDWEGIETLTINSPEEGSFAVCASGELLIIDKCGNYVYAPSRYEIFLYTGDL